jgi:hypothetical protein
MSESWQPTLTEIALVFSRLADRVSEHEQIVLDPYVEQALRDSMFHLELQIPGWEPPFDADAARAMRKAAQESLERGNEREAIGRALRGLSFSPHDPCLFYLLGSACFESGSVELALRILCHTLWINPGHAGARADLEALSAFLDDSDDQPRAA